MLRILATWCVAGDKHEQKRCVTDEWDSGDILNVQYGDHSTKARR